MISENRKSNFNPELLARQRSSQNFHFYVSTQNKLRRSIQRKNKVGCDSMHVCSLQRSTAGAPPSCRDTLMLAIGMTHSTFLFPDRKNAVKLN